MSSKQVNPKTIQKWLGGVLSFSCSQKKLWLFLFIICFFCSPFSSYGEELQARIFNTRGQVTYSLYGLVLTQAEATMSLPVGSSITTGANGSVVFSPFQGVTAIAESNSQIRLSRLEASLGKPTSRNVIIVIDLQEGTLVVEAKNLSPDVSLEIRTPQGSFFFKQGVLCLTFRSPKGSVHILGGSFIAHLLNGEAITVESGGSLHISGIDRGLEHTIQFISAEEIDLLQRGMIDMTNLTSPTSTANTSTQMIQQAVLTDFISPPNLPSPPSPSTTPPPNPPVSPTL